MRSKRLLLIGVLAVAMFSNLVIMSGCSSEETESKTDTKITDNDAVNDIKETKLENYQVNVISQYVHQTSVSGFALKFEVKFENDISACEAYVYNDMSSLADTKIQKENQERFDELKEKNPEISEDELYGDEYASLWYKSILATNVSYDAGEKVEIEWIPYPTEENYLKNQSEEEYLKDGYMYLILKDGQNITGFMVLEFPVETSGESSLVTYENINVLEAVSFEKADGKYQNVTLDYVKTRVDEVLKDK